MAIYRVRESSTSNFPDGATWESAFPSITGALEHARFGDRVLVAGGTYRETICLKDGVSVLGGYSGCGDAPDERTGAETVITAEMKGCVVAVPPGVGPMARLDGFTIRDGDGSRLTNLGRKVGGGILCVDASPFIGNNVIRLNKADEGGGIACLGSLCTPVIVQNTIVQNEAQYGGGVYCFHGAAPVLYQNHIHENKGGSFGGGIYADEGAAPWIIENTIAENRAEAAPGIYCGRSDGPVLVCPQEVPLHLSLCEAWVRLWEGWSESVTLEVLNGSTMHRLADDVINEMLAYVLASIENVGPQRIERPRLDPIADRSDLTHQHEPDSQKTAQPFGYPDYDKYFEDYR